MWDTRRICGPGVLCNQGQEYQPSESSPLVVYNAPERRNVGKNHLENMWQPTFSWRIPWQYHLPYMDGITQSGNLSWNWEVWRIALWVVVWDITSAPFSRVDMSRDQCCWSLGQIITRKPWRTDLSLLLGLGKLSQQINFTSSSCCRIAQVVMIVGRFVDQSIPVLCKPKPQVRTTNLKSVVENSILLLMLPMWLSCSKESISTHCLGVYHHGNENN